MTEATFPIKSERYEGLETWLTVIIAIVSCVAGRVILGPGILAFLPMMVAMIFFEQISDWLAKKLGAELVTYEERHRRLMEQWARAAFLSIVARYAWLVGCISVVSVATIFPVEQWPIPGITSLILGPVLGGLQGAYLWLSARRSEARRGAATPHPKAEQSGAA